MNYISYLHHIQYVYITIIASQNNNLRKHFIFLMYKSITSLNNIAINIVIFIVLFIIVVFNTLIIMLLCYI